ncbi:MAG TPA: hypothetical protein VFQ39_08390 [Longimicrobium sp.]|nr:hypothetical protein [Longimicrobium sp.]
MRKMKLDVEVLEVESFPVAAVEADARGTVRGNAVTAIRCGATLGSGCDTCQLSCTGSCATGLNCQQVC